MPSQIGETVSTTRVDAQGGTREERGIKVVCREAAVAELRTAIGRLGDVHRRG